MPNLFDMHCHLGFCEDAARAAVELAAHGVGVFSNTVTPAEFAAQKAALAGAPGVRVGAGLHPWWVGEGEGGADGGTGADGAAGAFGGSMGESAGEGAAPVGADGRPTVELGELCRLVAGSRFVGEVGLDFSPRRAAMREAQLQAFEAIARTCAEVGGKVLSVHAVRAVDDVLDVLERGDALADAAGNACIIHWFSGTSDQLTRARRAGCFFSVNPRMLESKRGRAYAQAIPENRLLLETDEPASAGASWSVERVVRLLEGMLSQLAALRSEDPAELGEKIAATSKRLLNLDA